jgi:hypothetical protein
MQVGVLWWLVLCLLWCVAKLTGYCGDIPFSMGFTRDQLIDIRKSLPAMTVLPSEMLRSIRSLGLNSIPATTRGTRGGKHVQRSINTLISARHQHSSVQQSGVNLANITQIQCNPAVSSSHVSNLSFAHINARSIKNKTTSLVDYIVDQDLDVVAISETWLGRDRRDAVVEGDICPAGYGLLHVPRDNGKGGGVAVLYKANLRVSKEVSRQYESFEHIEVRVSPANGNIFLLSVFYRPPPNRKNGLTTSQFFGEFSNFIDDRILMKEKIVICGDFNFHVDDKNDNEASSFCTLLSSFGLQQHVSGPTHSKGHTLDLLISRSDDSFIQDIKVKDMLISDHFWLHCLVLCSKPGTMQKEIKYRNIKSIDTDLFKKDIQESTLANADGIDDVATLVKVYDAVLSDLLDKHAPMKERKFTIRKESPWFTSEIGEAKRARRKAERKWRKTNLTIHRQIFLEAQQHVNNLIDHAKKQHYLKKVESADQKSLFKIVDTLLNKAASGSLPSHDSPNDLADRFGQFFSEKISKIRDDLTKLQIPGTVSPSDSQTPPSILSNFEPVTEDEVRKIIMSNKTKSCSQDPIPTSLLKECVSSLLPVITKIVNLSMAEGVMPAELKKALILPLLKKPGLDTEVLKHFRPVSNLTYISKVIERVVAQRLTKYLFANNLQEHLQSSYKKFHSTETALLKVQNDILQAIDGKKCILLVLLDLSAAFDTIDHKTLLSRLQKRLGINGTVLKWFESYLSDRSQSVLIEGVESELLNLLFGVPQGSVLGPILFILYTAPLGDLLRQFGISYHFYADDTQIYLSFDLPECDDAMLKMEKCVEMVRSWMAQNFLKLNEDKTEIIFFGSPNHLSKLATAPLKIGDEQIVSAEVVRNIGAFMDKTMSMDTQVGQICKGAWFHLRNIGKIRAYLDTKSTEKLIHAFVSSKLDSNNSLLYGIPKAKMDRLQRVQNSAARLVTLTPKYDHVTPVLKDLHWLPVTQRVQYKILLLTFKAIIGEAPQYLQELVLMSNQSRTLRSNGQKVLLCPRSKTVRYGDRSFAIAAPTLWNKLPQNLRMCDTINQFKPLLKTYLFKLAYDV